MDAEIFAEWLRRQGHRVIRTTSSYWYNQGPYAYQALPYHWLITPSAEELKEIFKTYKAMTLRYSTPLYSQVGHISYHAIYNDPMYDINRLSNYARKNVRRGLKNCIVKQISFQQLADEGWELQIDTLNRQGRDVAMTMATWHKLCVSASDLPGFSAWAALVQDKIAASVITFRMDDCAYMLYQQSHRQYLRDHVNNALSYFVTSKMLEEANITMILYGLHSLDAPPSIDEFKFRMGYHPKPVRQRVVFHPYLRPFINQNTHNWVKRLLQMRPGNVLLAKTEGMIRFYLEGQKPLAEQTWPPCLAAAGEAGHK